MPSKIFQSYIIVGDKKQTQAKVDGLLASLGIEVQASPDITITVPEKSISIEKIRELKTSIYQKPFSQKFKVHIIKEADKLTTEAQNALLKIFEEPPVHAIIILETPNLKNLLATLTSRAIVVNTVPENKITRQDDPTNLRDALLAIQNLNDPPDWIDQQIKNNYQILKKQIKNNQNFTKTISSIEDYKEAKLMTNANVNSKLVLANAILNSY